MRYILTIKQRNGIEYKTMPLFKIEIADVIFNAIVNCDSIILNIEEEKETNPVKTDQ